MATATASILRDHIEYIRGLARLLSQQRSQVLKRELQMQTAFARMVREYPGSLREIADQMNMSVAHLSRVQNGQRKVSDSVVQRLERLK